MPSVSPIQPPTLSSDTPMTGIVQARGLTKTFRMGDTNFTVLKELDFYLQPGEFVAIEGRSGSGKSTLLHILAALDSADAGRVEFQGADYTRHNVSPVPVWLEAFWIRPSKGLGAKLSWVGLILLTLIGAITLLISYGSVSETARHDLLAGSLITSGVATVAWNLQLLAFIWATLALFKREGPAARLRNKQFGFIFQFYHLLPELNVLENTLLAPSIEYSWLGFRLQKRALRKRATELLEQLGMGHRLKHRPSQLSGGERQRVAIARALMNNPKVLFADEPTGNLDADTGRQIMDVLEKLHRERGQTVVMVTHDRSLAREADRVLVLRDGKLETAG